MDSSDEHLVCLLIIIACLKILAPALVQNRMILSYLVHINEVIDVARILTLISLEVMT